MNYSRFLNAVSLARKSSPIRIMTELYAKGPPSMVSLAGGSPNPELFPFEQIDVKLRGGNETLQLSGKALNTALQYQATQGIPSLLSWLRKLQDTVHCPKVDYKISMSCGSQDGIGKAMEMLVNPGDLVLIDKPSYSGTLSCLRPLGVQFLDIETDEFGTIPESLERIMSQWDHVDPYSAPTSGSTDIPRFLYTIPNGVNPTGACMTQQRKEKIYQIANRYNLLILEDDPYYYLQFHKPAPSFLSMDTDGRVLRFDSFSKIVSSGLRLGVTTGPAELVDRIILHHQVSSMHCSSLSQVLLVELFERWNIDGFLQHTQRVTEFYEKQKNTITELAKQHLTGLAEWHEPKAGMFLWMKLPSIKDTSSLAMKAVDKEVLVLPGNVFYSNTDEPCSYIRLSYSLATREQMEKALKCLADLIREEQKK